jgi:hypothetical protein
LNRSTLGSRLVEERQDDCLPAEPGERHGILSNPYRVAPGALKSGAISPTFSVALLST